MLRLSFEQFNGLSSIPPVVKLYTTRNLINLHLSMPILVQFCITRVHQTQLFLETVSLYLTYYRAVQI